MWLSPIRFVEGRLKKVEMKTRIPFDKDYVKLVGIAVYLFSYYEWAIIYIIEKLEPGFVAEYCRKSKKPMTSGDVSKRFKGALQNSGGHTADKAALKRCSREFANLIQKRNALLHAHPITDIGGAQILNYQGKLSKPISDLKWTNDEIKRFIKEIDEAACRTSKRLHHVKT